MKNRATGFSANMMMLGTEVSQPIDVLFGAALRGEGSQDPGIYLKHLREVLQEVHALAATKLCSQMHYQKWTYDLKLQEHHYEVGDLVFRRREAQKVGSSKKLNTVWIGPLLVVEVINPVLYWVRDRKRQYVLHHDLLKCCEDRVVPLWIRKMHHELMDLDTTIAYDEAEQGEESIPVGKDSTQGKRGAVMKGSKIGDTEGSSSKESQEEGYLKDVSPGMDTTMGADSGVILYGSQGEGCSKDISPGGDTTSGVLEGDNLDGSGIDEEVDPIEDMAGADVIEDQAESMPTNVSWIDKTRDLGLNSLFSESPVVHIYAQQGKAAGRGKGKKEYSPVESVSRAGRQRKIPAHLQNYKY